MILIINLIVHMLFECSISNKPKSAIIILIRNQSLPELHFFLLCCSLHLL